MGQVLFGRGSLDVPYLLEPTVEIVFKSCWLLVLDGFRIPVSVA
jgi:hypothetical protein